METNASAMPTASNRDNEFDDQEFEKALKAIGVDVEDYEKSTNDMFGPRRDIGPRFWW